MSDTPNRIRRIEPMRGERAYMHGFKARAQRHHCIGHGTFSVEAERMEALRKEYSRKVGPITNVPLFIKAAALTLRRNPEANAILFNGWFGRRIAHFERVDVNLPITRQIGERWITFIATVRDPASKPLVSIQEEITGHQRCPPEQSPAIQRFLKLDRLPNWLIGLFHWRMTRSPEYYVQTAGTCGVTLVENAEWCDHLFPIAPTSVVFGLGGVKREPVVRGEQVAIARMIKCVLMADNYVIPGLVGARLANDFRELLQTGSFISDEIARAGPTA